MLEQIDYTLDVIEMPDDFDRCSPEFLRDADDVMRKDYETGARFLRENGFSDADICRRYGFSPKEKAKRKASEARLQWWESHKTTIEVVAGIVAAIAAVLGLILPR